jgi:hypothetical protein
MKSRRKAKITKKPKKQAQPMQVEKRSKAARANIAEGTPIVKKVVRGAELLKGDPHGFRFQACS